MSAAEYATLEAGTEPWREGYLDWCVSRFIHLFGLPLFGVLLATPVFALLDYLHWLPSTLGSVALVLGALAGLFVGMRVLRGYRSTEQESRSLFRQDIATGRVRILHCTISRAVEFPVDEDEGPGYFLEVGERQALYLHNACLHEYEGNEADQAPPLFPNRKVDVVQAIVSRTTLSVLCLGEPLGEWQTREEWPDPPYFPEDGEVLTVSLDTLDDDLRRLGRRDEAVKPE